jgi:glutaredoxin-related protein
MKDLTYFKKYKNSIKILGSSLFDEDPNDIDVFTYSKKVYNELKKETEFKIHPIKVKLSIYNKLENLSSWRNHCKVWQNGNIIYGKDFIEDTKNLYFNKNSIQYFNSFEKVNISLSKLICRGYDINNEEKFLFHEVFNNLIKEKKDNMDSRKKLFKKHNLQENELIMGLLLENKLKFMDNEIYLLSSYTNDENFISR